MRVRGLLAAILLGVGLSLVPGLGHGKLHPMFKEDIDKKVSSINYHLLEVTVRYIMCNHTSFLWVEFAYDKPGFGGFLGFITKFPEGINTEGKIIVQVYDNRGVFSRKSGIVLLEEFKKKLEIIYSFISFFAWDMDNDIVAKFYSTKKIPLGYFHQGEYHLWEK